jgi:hypothetical protein
MVVVQPGSLLKNAGCVFFAELGFVSGHRFSDAVSRLKTKAPLGAGV